MDNDDVQSLLRQFKLVCRKCSSENVVVDADPGFGGSEVTGAEPGTLSVGCNDCKNNDFFC